MYIKLLREWLEWGNLQSTQWQMAWAHQLIGIHFMSPLQHWTHPAFKGKCAMLLHSLGNNTKRWFGSQTNRDSTWFNIKCETQIRSHKQAAIRLYMIWHEIALQYDSLHYIPFYTYRAQTGFDQSALQIIPTHATASVHSGALEGEPWIAFTLSGSLLLVW